MGSRGLKRPADDIAGRLCYAGMSGAPCKHTVRTGCTPQHSYYQHIKPAELLAHATGNVHVIGHLCVTLL